MIIFELLDRLEGYDFDGFYSQIQMGFFLTFGSYNPNNGSGHLRSDPRPCQRDPRGDVRGPQICQSNNPDFQSLHGKVWHIMCLCGFIKSTE